MVYSYAFQYIISNGGLTTETGYPYSATGPNTCDVTTPLAATISGYCDVQSGSEKALEAAVAVGPVSVAIEADQACFQFYSGGIMSDPSCGTQLDHGVLAVGFGVQGSQKYWKVKNSWYDPTPSLLVLLLFSLSRLSPFFLVFSCARVGVPLGA